MPGIEDWINFPLPIIQRLFEESHENHASKVEEYFKKRIETAQIKGQLPSLNDIPTHNLLTNSVVRYRAMVQDMYDPEFFLGAYEVENSKTGQTYMKSGKYRDIADCGPQEEIKLDSARNKTMDRQTYYCVPVPGEGTWVKQAYAKQNGSQLQSVPSTSVIPERCKRSLEEDEEDEGISNGSKIRDASSKPTESMDTEPQEGTPAECDDKKRTANDRTKSQSSDPLDLNFPLPGETGPACIVKVYNSDEAIKLNDIVDVVGVLSNDPAMASFPSESRRSAYVDPMEEMMDDEDQTPPPSLVPRLHALTICRREHSNPLLPQTQKLPQDQEAVTSILSEASSLRSVLLSVLTKLLFGDELVAEFLLCHLVSSVYARHNVVALGKFGLNISGCPKAGSFPKLLHGFLKEIVTKSHYLPMSLSNMNKLKFSPVKDYKANRLQTGILQLSAHTHLVLDETALETGQLDSHGVSNMTALGNVISWQKVDYDFNFHKQEFQTDIVTLVLSEGKSILKCDCQIPLVARGGGIPSDIEAHFTQVLTSDLSSLELMDKLRAYVGLVQILPYEVSELRQKEIEQDFVDARKEDQSNMSVDDFHGLLVLARLLSLTHGERTLSKETWEKAKLMEVDRKLRLVLTSPAPRSN